MSSPDQIPQELPPELAPAYAGQIAAPKSQENPAWNLWDVLAIAAFALASQIMIAILAGAAVTAARHLARFRTLNPEAIFKSVSFSLALETTSYVMVVSLMVLLVARKGTKGFFREIGWNAPQAGWALLTILGGVGMTIMSLACGALLERWTPKSLPMQSYFNSTLSAYALAFFGTLVAPLVEELFFRGFLYPALARRIGVVAGVVLTSGGFSLLHATQLGHAWAPLLVIFLVGVCLTIVRAITKSVATTVLLHSSYNFTLFALMFLATSGFHRMDRLSG